MTQRLHDAVLERYWRGEAVSSLTRWCGVPERTLWRMVARSADQMLHAPRETSGWRELTHLGIDELFWQGRVLCVIVNLVSGELLDLLPDRDVETVVASLTELRSVMTDLGQPAWRPVLTMDMWQPYRQAAQFAFGEQVIVVTDRFHLQAKISEDLHSLVRELLPVHRHRPAVLRRLRATFHRACRSGQLPPPDLSGVPDGHLLVEVVHRTLALAVGLHGVWEATDDADALRRYRRWLWEAARFEVETGHLPFARIRYQIELWHDEVFNYFRPESRRPDGRRATNAPVEALNARLRQLERRSRRQQRSAFRPQVEGGHEQHHFERLWCSAMFAINTRRLKSQPLRGSRRPAISVCTCGQGPAEVVWKQGTPLRDVPLGDQPVVVESWEAQCRCTQCHRTWREGLDHHEGLTRELVTYLERQRAAGQSLLALTKISGVSRSRLLRALRPPALAPRGGAPAELGLQVWRWRRVPRWVLTDARSGALLDLLPDAEPATLRALLHSAWAQPVQVAVLGRPEWQDHLPEHVAAALDRFTATQPVQRALLEVQRRFTHGITVPARRQAAFHRHRRLILRRAEGRLSLDERRRAAEYELRLGQLLDRSPELRVAVEQRDAFCALLRGQPEGVEAALDTWLHTTRNRTWPLLTAPAPSTPQHTLRYAFRDATQIVERSASALVLGCHLQTQGIHLASSRVLLRHLREMAAAGQPEFEVLRGAAIRRFGP